ncbi:hypothetical protein [Paenibacillus jamilae]|uniref:hypothetical protein n=1 Tax=Paenibacillus jamilae TaxID=114136 RepID=UPI00128EE7BF|nr:hypothetical protein [Paenibacillus jamilae]
MASVYEMNQLKTGVGAGYQKQITTVEYHVKSIVDSFISLIQTETADRLQLAEGYEETIGQRSAEISAQQDEIRDLAEQLRQADKDEAELRKQLSEQSVLIETLQKSSSKDEQILAENKERIDRLSKLLSDNTEKVNQAEQLEQRFTELTELTENQAKQLAEAQEAAEAAEKHFSDELARNEALYVERLERAAEKAAIEQQKAILDVRQSLLEQHEKERAELLASIQKADREHNEELRKLYAEMDKLRQQLAAPQQVRAARKPKGGGESE